MWNNILKSDSAVRDTDVNALRHLRGGVSLWKREGRDRGQMGKEEGT
jgi:hypothetical protein